VCVPVGGRVLAMAVKLPRGGVCDGGVHVFVGCSVCWCVGPSSRVSFGPQTMASLVSKERVSSGDKDDNAPASRMVLIFTDVALLRCF
jgi:hypothetical protein